MPDRRRGLEGVRAEWQKELAGRTARLRVQVEDDLKATFEERLAAQAQEAAAGEEESATARRPHSSARKLPSLLCQQATGSAL